MKQKKLPSFLNKQLKEFNITPTEIIVVSSFDLSMDSTYITGYLFLTKNHLGKITCQLPDNKIKYFKGTFNDPFGSPEKTAEYDIALYELSKLSNPEITHMVATNMITANYNGLQITIAALSNLYLEETNYLLRQLTNLQAGKEIETFEEENIENTTICPICGNPYPDASKKICPKCTNKKSIFIRMLKYFFKYKIQFIVLFLTYFLAAVISLAWPYLSGTVLFDYILKKDNAFLKNFGLENEYFLALALLVLSMIVCKFLNIGISILRMTLMAKITTKTVRDLKQDIFASMGQLSINFFTSKQTGGLMTRVESDADHVTNFFLDGFPYIFVHSFTIIASFIVMYSLNWKMALAACILLPLLVVMSVKLKPALWGLFGRRHRAEKSVTAKTNDSLTGARVVKAFGQENSEIEAFQKPNHNLEQAEVNIVKYNNRFTILYNLVQEISNIWVWILGVILLLNSNAIQLGVLITFVSYVGQLNGPMNFFSRVFHMWSDSINSAQRMFEIIDAIPDIKEKENPIHLDNPSGEIELSNVSFGYEVNKTVLKNMNLKIKSGEMLGIVGRSGAGKTTLVNLISRLYDVNEGNIKIDGIDVKDLAFHDLRKNVAMVSQDTYIFMGTVAQNIAYANPSASKADIIRAAILASAHEFISNMPDGYDTIIGAGGKDLSGGEKQRISIARAILANPKILILDEATASVDTETEKAIQASINYLVKGRTTLSIAHRLSTLRDADRLIVIDNGKIVEEGTHEELEKLGGIYHKLMELQTKSLALKDLSEVVYE